MKIKRLSSLIVALIVFLGMLTACSDGNVQVSDDGGKSTTEDTSSKTGDTGTDGEQLGKNNHVDGGTEMELWTFQELHVNFYTDMADKWNEINPDRPINLTVTTGQTTAMQTKLLVALQSGTGAPDIADIEVGRFGNFIKDTPLILPLNDIIEPEEENIVMSRVEMYSDNEGNIYGIDFHVGASVTYYNMEIMDAAGVDPSKIVTWDDYYDAGKKVLEKTGVAMCAVETRDLFLPQCMMLEKGIQFVDDTGMPNINTEEHAEVIEYIRHMIEDGICEIAAGGGYHTEEWYGYMNGGGVASLTMPLWYMGRFTDYMSDLEGKIAIYPDPVWNEGDVRSVCQGGTGTGVTNQADDPKFAKEFLAYCKLSDEGNRYIWEKLGFDPIRTSLWTDASVTENKENKFLNYFLTNPFDILNEVGSDLTSVNIKGGYASSYAVLVSTTYQNAFESSLDQDANELLENEQASIIYDK